MSKSFVDEKIFSYLPFLGVGIAIAFDVGYFWGIDINFFTLFSLSEHTLFALEALPIAIVTLVIIVLCYALAARVRKIDKSWAARLDQKIQTTRIAKTRRLWKIARLVIANWPIIIIVVITLHQYWTANYHALAISIIILSLIITYRVGDFDLDGFRQLTVLGTTVLGLSVAFVCGHLIASTYILGSTSDHTLKSKSGHEQKIRLIRAGEKGILFVNPEQKTVIYQSWSDFDLLSRRVP